MDLKGPCASNPCFNNGICENHALDYYCKCPNGYAGDNCETSSFFFNNYFRFFKIINVIQKAPCSVQPCKNAGECRNSGSSYKCFCQEGFSGKTCEESKLVLLII